MLFTDELSIAILIVVVRHLRPLVAVGGECHDEGDDQDQDFHPHDSSMICMLLSVLGM